MADTLKDYLIGFGFDVDEGGAGQIQSMLKDLDNIVRNLAQVLSQATDQVQNFMSGLQQQSQASNDSASSLARMSKSANDAKEHVGKANDTIKNTGDAAKQATPAVEGLSNALSGMMKFVKVIAGAAVVKKFLDFGKSLYEYDQSLEATAKSLKKTKEEARAHTKALEAMGKTYEEIKKDKSLKATYDELVELGESMALPEAEGGVDNVREMVASFEKLKMVGSYAMQWLYHTVQDVAAGPLRRFKEVIDDVTDGLKLNLPKLSVAGAHIIDGILRIVSSFAKGIKAILDLLGKIPGPIKVILGLIGAVAWAIKSGPFGWMVMILTAIGLLLDDFFTYMEGGEALLGPFWDACIKAFENVKKAITDAIDAIKGFWEASQNDDGSTDWIGFGSKIAGWIIDGIRDGLSDIATKIKTWITGDENASWDQVGTAIVEKVKAGIENVQGVGKQIIEAIFQLVNEQGITDDITALLTNASDFAGGILKAIVDSIPDLAEGAAENFTAIIEGIAGIINGKFLTEDIPSLITNADKWVTAILQSIKDAIPLVGDSANEVLTAIVTAICGLINGVTSDEFMGSLGGFAVNLITGLAGVLGSAVEETGDLSKTIADAIPGVVNNLFGALEKTFTEENINKVGDSIKSFIVSLFKGIGDTLSNMLGAVGELDGFDLGESAGNIVNMILEKIFTVTGDLASDPNVTGFVEKVGAALSDALGTIGSFIGTAAGKIVGFIFSAEGLTQIYNTAKSVGKLIIQGIVEGVSGFGNFILNIVEGILVGLGVIDQETIEGMRESGEQLVKTAELAMEQGLEDTDPAMMLANWARKGVGKNNSALDAATQDMVDMFGGMIGAVADEVTKDGGSADQFRDKLLAKLVESYADRNVDDYDLLNSFYDGNGFNVDTALSGLNLDPEDFLPNFDDLDFWGSMMQAVQSGDSAGVADLVNNMLIGKIDFGEVEEQIKDQGEEAVTNAVDEIGEIIGDQSESLNMDDLFSEVDENAPRQAVDAMATTISEGRETVEDAAAEVSDAAVQKFLLTMSNENGASIAQTFIDGMVEKLGELSSQVEDVVRLVNAKFASIPGKAKSAFSSLVSNIKSTLDPLPQYVSEIVTKINDELGKIKKNININTTTSGDIDGNSEGSVIDKETITRVGEGNKREYIIPVTKPNRAIPLLERAAKDLGLSVQSYANATKMLGGSADKAVTPSYATTNSSSVVNNYNSTIDARANINVSGSDPVSTANNVNRTHEQIVLRNVKPMLG